MGLFEFKVIDKTPTYLMNVYAPYDIINKRKLWTDQQTLIIGEKHNWHVMGTFTTKANQEIMYSNNVSRSMSDFASFIHDSRFVDIPLTKSKYTWCHSNRSSIN